MANTITAVLPSIFAGLDMVSRELIGAIPAVQRDASMERTAVGQTVTVPVVPAAVTGNVTPGSIPPDDGDDTIGSIPVSITKSMYSPVRWNGEEQLALGPTGQYNKILADQFAQAMRALANLIEVDLCAAGIKNASRAQGTAGTTPFGTAGDLTDFAGINRILDENGAPMMGRHLIVGSAARQNLEGKQSVLFKVNEAGDNGAFLNKRVAPQVQLLNLGFSAGVQFFNKGTGAGYVLSKTGGQVVGDTSLLVGTGTGTILQGDIVTLAGDANKYVSSGLAAGTLGIDKPGLKFAAASATAVSVGNSYTGNIAFTENAMVLAARAPALPTGGDSADDRMMVTDPVSGLSFEVSVYREYRRVRYEVAMAWGVGVVKKEHIAILLG